MAMSASQRLLDCFLAGLLCAAAGCHSRDQAADWAAKAARVVGQARYTTNNGVEWRLLSPGTVLPEGSVVQTAREEKTYVDLLLGDGAGPRHTGSAAREWDVVRLHADTALGIDKRMSIATQAGGVLTETVLDLRQGHLTGRVEQMALGAIYEVKFGGGIAGFRDSGLAYDLRWQEPLAPTATNWHFVVTMQSGTAVLSEAGNATVIIPAGSTFDDTTTNVAPSSAALQQEIAAIVKAMR